MQMPTTTITNAFKALTTTLVAKGGLNGLTAKELCALANVHHGTASGSLSFLHKDGEIFRLAEKRNGYKLYVTRNNVIGRVTEEQGRR
jgi:hypothetical protein